VVPGEATAHSCLMHGLLAVSALHLNQFDLKDRNRYRTVAVRYQNLAIPPLRALLSNANEQNCEAIFVVATLVMVFAFAFPRLPGGSQNFDPVKEILTVFELMSGVTAVTDMTWHWIAKGKLGPLLRLASLDERVLRSPEPLPEDVEAAIKQLELHNGTLIQSESKAKIYGSAIGKLRMTCKAVTLNPNDPGFGLLWLGMVKRPYIDLLRNSDQMALVILAHYGVVLHSARDVWYSRDWGYQLVKAVYGKLHSKWRPWIQWPTSEVGLQPQFSVAESLHSITHDSDSRSESAFEYLSQTHEFLQAHNPPYNAAQIAQASCQSGDEEAISDSDASEYRGSEFTGG
jgi:hypothetical protein